MLSLLCHVFGHKWERRPSWGAYWEQVFGKSEWRTVCKRCGRIQWRDSSGA